MSFGERVVVVGMVLVLVLVFWAMVDEARRWERFKTEHHCKVIAHVKGNVMTGVGVGSNGGVTTTIISEPDKTGWLCDDGVTYYR